MTFEWCSWLEQAVTPLHSGVRDLNVTGYRPPGEYNFRPSKTAAVLVPLLDFAEPEIVLTRRAEHLLQHAGQISFPGGAAEDDDSSAVQTALREAEEEIGLSPDAVRPLGFLDRLDTISDYRVLPVVAMVTTPVEWVPDEREVSEVFTVPVSIALDPDRYESRVVRRHGREYTLYSLKWNDYNIWGATAGILMNLIFRLRSIHETRSADFARSAE
jgi:8-oxo-dGTP pyrophosphatase MutT (NUDIX family)